MTLLEDIYKERNELRTQLAAVTAERDRLRERIAALKGALEEIADGPHEGEGWCYGRHGTRPCSCHKWAASQAIAACEEEEPTP